MGSQRQTWLTDLEASAGDPHDPQLPRSLFKILYDTGMLQMVAAARMLMRHVPTYQVRCPHPAGSWDILADPESWARLSDDSWIQADPEHPADAAFLSGALALHEALTAPADPATQTSRAAYAILQAIEARRSDVWAAADPQAVSLWRLGKLMPERANTPLTRTTQVSEWQALAEVLRELDVVNVSDPLAPTAIDAAATRWIERECEPFRTRGAGP